MKITDIKQQVKREGRYSIFIDGTFSFGLSESALMQSGLRIGRELTAVELDELKNTAKEDKAYNQTLGLLARRPRSEWEISSYLQQKAYSPELVGQIIARLRDGNWLDDLDFAQRWVANRRLLKRTSRRRLQQELRSKRVSDEIIKQVLAEDETDEKEVLVELVARKRTQSRYQDPQKLMAYLIRQGYSYSDVKAVLSLPEAD